jgi:alkanesulfonate monooxygenase SsuD/methylene tetrahydromethanopterin reductase-like flavin-dependent oxidoreductase (luciferase family)
MRLSLMSLGDMIDDPVTSTRFSAPEKYRMWLEAASIADRGGFHGINFGEHHGIEYTFSAPPVMLAAIAARTQKLRLGTAVALAANLDPWRLAEDYATVDVISGGRVELVTGRGNFFESTYALFGQDAASSAARFAEAMELLCVLWKGEPVQWSGKFRPPINGERLQPTPVQQGVPPFWIGGGSSPETAQLAGRLGLKLMLPSAFGRPDKFVAVVDIYRESFDKARHAHKSEVGACWHGWVAKDAAEAHRRFRPRYEAYHRFSQQLLKRVNPNPPAYLIGSFDYDTLTTKGPAIVGSPQQFLDRLATLDSLLRADVNLLKMDMGGVPTSEFLDMVQLLADEVVPRLGAGATATRGT